ncbi:hypothetical protein ACC691_37585, partial [Rhizobium johnstonii]|uniref:hypothetical protein n=1 Tax=Rhizobium johnstonii TaxID=3019933 RepID=UPI003F9BBE2C
GAWLEPGLAGRLARERLAHRHAVDAVAAVVTPFGAVRLDASRALSAVSPATIATGVDVWFAEPSELRMPWPGDPVAIGDRLELGGPEWTLVLEGATLDAGRVGVRDH